MGNPLFNMVILFLPLVVHLVMDSLRILVKKKFVNHLRSGLVTAITGIVVALFLHLKGIHPWWASVIAMLCIHFGLFSFLLNIVRMVFRSLEWKWSSLWYLGKGSWWDRKLIELDLPPWGLLLMWFWFTGVGIGFGWNLDLIIHGYDYMRY